MTTDIDQLAKTVKRALTDLGCGSQAPAWGALNTLRSRLKEAEAQLERQEAALRQVVAHLTPDPAAHQSLARSAALAALSTPPNQEDEPLQNATEVAEPGAGPFKDVAEREAVEDGWL